MSPPTLTVVFEPLDALVLAARAAEFEAEIGEVVV